MLWSVGRRASALSRPIWTRPGSLQTCIHMCISIYIKICTCCLITQFIEVFGMIKSKCICGNVVQFFERYIHTYIQSLSLRSHGYIQTKMSSLVYIHMHNTGASSAARHCLSQNPNPRVPVTSQSSSQPSETLPSRTPSNELVCRPKLPAYASDPHTCGKRAGRSWRG
jgi:hypothetical protein